MVEGHRLFLYYEYNDSMKGKRYHKCMEESMYPAINTLKTGERIKELMEERNISVKQIQAYLGLGSIQTIYHWFENISIPSIDNIYALSRLFNVSIDDILIGDVNLKSKDRQHLNRLYMYSMLENQILIEKEFY